MGVFVGQDGHDGEGGQAVFYGIAPYAIFTSITFVAVTQ